MVPTWPWYWPPGDDPGDVIHVQARSPDSWAPGLFSSRDEGMEVHDLLSLELFLIWSFHLIGTRITINISVICWSFVIVMSPATN